MEKRKLAIRKGVPDASNPDAGGEPSSGERHGSLADLFGALKGTISISPHTNLTDPIDEGWNAAR